MRDLPPVIILGGNELASATAIDLVAAGFRVLMYVVPEETYLRYPLCFGDALRAGQKRIQEVTASVIPEEKLADLRAMTFAEKIWQAAQFLQLNRQIPIVADVPLSELFSPLKEAVVINTLPADAIQLPDGYEHLLYLGCFPMHRDERRDRFLVEVRWNYQLGKIVPPDVGDTSKLKRDPHFFHFPFQSCHTPLEGLWTALKQIGEPVRYNEAIGEVDGIEIRSPYDGQLWGLAHSGQFVAAGQEVALIYTGRPTENYRDFSFQERVVARGFLVAILKLMPS